MSQKSIFIVEDESVVSLDIRASLQQLGYAVAGHAVSGEEAILKVGQTAPDLVLMDIHLKGEMNGIEAAREISTRYHLPVIFLSAFADQDTLQRAQVAEAFAYIVKPFSEREAQLGNHHLALQAQHRAKPAQIAGSLPRHCRRYAHPCVSFSARWHANFC